jgi:hypothetical protein
MTKFEIAQSSLELLQNSLLHFCPSQDYVQEFRGTFVHQHCTNVAKLMQDVIGLERAGFTGTTRFIVRPMLESLFSLSAAIADETFADAKFHDELFLQVRHLARSLDKGYLPDAEAIKVFEDQKAQLSALLKKQEEKIKTDKRRDCRVSVMADLGGLTRLYDTYYFDVNDHIHSSMAGVLPFNSGIKRTYMLHVATFVTLQTVIKIVRNNGSQERKDLDDQAMHLLGEANLLLQKDGYEKDK